MIDPNVKPEYSGSQLGEVFISYRHDNVDHVKQVLALSNKLRSEGIDCVLDQYETSPPEGWPRWMEKKIRDAQFVLMSCTEGYYKRVMGEEDRDKGLGVKWEGNLIYQHIYNAGAENSKFIPVLFEPSHQIYIPTPLQGASRYCISTQEGYDALYFRLLNRPKVERPTLGRLSPLPEKPVKTNPIMYLTGPIDIDLWNQAKWEGIFAICYAKQPPVLGLAFQNEKAAREIFDKWHERYGAHDAYEELRISIIEGDVPGEEPGYTVHVNADPDAAIRRCRDAGYKFDGDILMRVGRVHRMNPQSESTNLELFKRACAHFKTYLLAPGIITSDKLGFKPIVTLGIHKGIINFRNATDIKEGDPDSVVFKAERQPVAPLDRGILRRPDAVE